MRTRPRLRTESNGWPVRASLFIVMTAQHVFRVKGSLTAPTMIPLGPGGGPPLTLEPRPRLVSSVQGYGDIGLAFVVPPDPIAPDRATTGDPNWMPALIVADVPVDGDFNDALARAEVLIKDVIDLTSFTLAAPVWLGPIDAIDVTRPISVNDERDCQIWSSPPFGRFARGIAMSGVHGQTTVGLPTESPLEFGPRERAALRWFIKSLGTDLVHDQFIFLWITLESSVTCQT